MILNVLIIQFMFAGTIPWNDPPYGFTDRIWGDTMNGWKHRPTSASASAFYSKSNICVFGFGFTNLFYDSKTWYLRTENKTAITIDCNQEKPDVAVDALFTVIPMAFAELAGAKSNDPIFFIFGIANSRISMGYKFVGVYAESEIYPYFFQPMIWKLGSGLELGRNIKVAFGINKSISNTSNHNKLDEQIELHVYF